MVYIPQPEKFLSEIILLQKAQKNSLSLAKAHKNILHYLTF